MKIAIITDQHLGTRNDKKVFLDMQEKFYKNTFFPKLEEYGIKTILDLGDTFDRRKYINFHTLHRAREFYFNPIIERGITLHSILGNHTTYFKNTNEVNSMELLYSNSDQIHVYRDDPVELCFDSLKILMVPWLTKENQERSLSIIDKTDASILMGHLEIHGFEMIKGQVCEGGIKMDRFRKFDSVYSGHFHHPSVYSNIRYLGAPYEMVWSDYEGRRGFHILDTETRELEFIPNPYKMFYKIDYDDSNLKVEDLDTLDFSKYEDAYVKLIVREKTNSYIFDLFLDKLAEFKVFDLKIVENTSLEFIEEELIDEAQDTKEILSSYVSNLETNLNKSKINTKLNVLYDKAMRS